MREVPTKAFVLYTSCLELIVFDSLQSAEEEFVREREHEELG